MGARESQTCWAVRRMNRRFMVQALEDKAVPDCRGTIFLDIDPDIDALSTMNA